jgi:hypothetical protein
MTRYKIGDATKEGLKEFIQPSIEINSLLEKEDLSEEEINFILAFLGKLPAAMTFFLIEDLRSAAKIEPNAE